MQSWFAIAVGGAIGAMARHAVNKLAGDIWPLWRFPVATVIVNVAGCFIIGILAGMVTTGRLPMRPMWRDFVFVGILGGFTTFSTFGLDTVTLLRAGGTSQAFWNVALHVGGGIAGVYSGLVLFQRFGSTVR